MSAQTRWVLGHTSEPTLLRSSGWLSGWNKKRFSGYRGIIIGLSLLSFLPGYHRVISGYHWPLTVGQSWWWGSQVKNNLEKQNKKNKRTTIQHVPELYQSSWPIKTSLLHYLTNFLWGFHHELFLKKETFRFWKIVITEFVPQSNITFSFGIEVIVLCNACVRAI